MFKALVMEYIFYYIDENGFLIKIIIPNLFKLVQKLDLEPSRFIQVKKELENFYLENDSVYISIDPYTADVKNTRILLWGDSKENLEYKIKEHARDI